MCKGTIQAALALTLGMAASASAGPVLLSSYSETSSGARAPWSDPRVRFEIGLTSPMTGQGAHIGGGVLWSEDQTGFFDFAESNSVDFPVFEQLATNGVENQGSIIALWSSGAGGGHGIKEAVLFDRFPPIGRPPDLIGYDLEFIRLIVNRLNFTPWTPEPGLEGLQYSFDITIESYGHLVPEPATVALLLAGLAFSRRWRSKREQSSHSRLDILLCLWILFFIASGSDTFGYDSGPLSQNSVLCSGPGAFCDDPIAFALLDVPVANGSVTVELAANADFRNAGLRLGQCHS